MQGRTQQNQERRQPKLGYLQTKLVTYPDDHNRRHRNIDKKQVGEVKSINLQAHKQRQP